MNEWTEACFGSQIAKDKTERSHRFLEEVFELVQSLQCEKSDILSLVDYVYARKQGDASKEVGDVLLTLSALCNSIDVNLETSGEDKLNEVWRNIEKIRDKRSRKRSKSALP